MSRTSTDPRGRRVLALTFVLAFTASAALAQDGPPPPPEGISIESLLAEGGDLRELASMPRDPFRLETFVPEGEPVTKKRGRRIEHVLAEMKGPGAIVGIWMAKPEGKLRVYVDGSAIPAVEVDAKSALTGSKTIFPTPTAGAEAAGGRLLYPLPFATAVEVTCDRAVDFEVVCRRYTGKDVKVHSFDPNAAAQAYFTARGAMETWKAMPVPPPVARVEGRNELEPATFDVDLAPGARHVVFAEKNEKPHAVLRLAVECVGDVISPDTLARVRLLAKFDGVECIDVPLVDFLGATRGFAEHGTLLSRAAVRADGLVRWRGLRLPMPYRESIELTVHHTGTRAAGLLRFHVEREPWPWDDRTLHLHAAERVRPTDASGPWSAVELSGSGALVGLGLRIAGRAREPRPVTLRVDGAARRLAESTEHHFFAPPGARPEHASTLVRVRNGRDFQRWRVLDRITFAKNLSIDVDSAPGKGRRRQLSAVAVWYAPVR